jgi:hypothetical protein
MEIVVNYKQPAFSDGVSLSSIDRTICKHFEITSELLKSPKRNAYIVKPRHIFCSVAHLYSNASLTKIGQYLNRDHTTIIHAIKSVKRDMSGDADFQEFMLKIAKEAFAYDEERRIYFEKEAEKIKEGIKKRKKHIPGLRHKIVGKASGDWVCPTG